MDQRGSIGTRPRVSPRAVLGAQQTRRRGPAYTFTHWGISSPAFQPGSPIGEGMVHPDTNPTPLHLPGPPCSLLLSSLFLSAPPPHPTQPWRSFKTQTTLRGAT